jgi:hypothetical protein
MIQTINREHPEYMARKATWRRYRDLYVGGDQLRERGQEYLVRRQKEPAEVYQERLIRLFYENYIGSIIDWYAATLMHREPVVMLDQCGAPAGGFYNTFFADCDLKGTRLSQFFRERFTQMLVCGSSFTVVDFPRTAGRALTRAEEDASGQSRAFLVDYGPDEVINWNRDERGGLEWVVIRSSCLQQSKVTDAKWEKETRWVYYDRENFQIYRKAGESSPVELVDEGQHCLAPLGRVPVFEMKVTEGLWLMNKAALLQLEHFNQSNALSWALTMGLFAMPVVYSDSEFKQVVGETYYLQLGKDDRFGWAEPDGKVYQIAANNLDQLKSEIYRVCYLMTQAGDASGSAARQSGLSKQLDFVATEEVLRAYGAVVKETMTQVLGAVAAARQDEIAIGVTGLDDFDIDEFGTELDDAKNLLALGIGSRTLTKQVFKRLALKYLSDARPEIKNQVVEEIEQTDYGKPGGITDPVLQ